MAQFRQYTQLSDPSSSTPVTPIITYTNADIDKFKILSDNKDKTGIYQWQHLESGKSYVGSAMDLSVRIRRYYNLSNLEANKNRYIDSALRLHGYSAFSLIILEYIDIKDITKPEAKKIVLKREQYYLDLLSPHYNILKLAGNSLGYKHSPEVITKFSTINKGINNPMYGRTGDKNILSKKVYVYESLESSNPFKIFNSYTEAAIYFNCHRKSIYRYIDTKKVFKMYVLSSEPFNSYSKAA